MDQGNLTRAEIIRASGEYPHRSDEQLRNDAENHEKRAGRLGLGIVGGLVMMFVFLLVGVQLCDEHGNFTTLGGISETLAFVSLITFAYCGFEQPWANRAAEDLRHELRRRGEPES